MQRFQTPGWSILQNPARLRVARRTQDTRQGACTAPRCWCSTAANSEAGCKRRGAALSGLLRRREGMTGHAHCAAPPCARPRTAQPAHCIAPPCACPALGAPHLQHKGQQGEEQDGGHGAHSLAGHLDARHGHAHTAAARSRAFRAGVSARALRTGRG